MDLFSSKWGPLAGCCVKTAMNFRVPSSLENF